MTQTAAAHPVQLSYCSPEGCCCGKRELLPDLWWRLALCSPSTPHPANLPRPRPRLRPVLPAILTIPTSSSCPSQSRPASPECPARPAPLPAPQQWGYPVFQINETAAGIRLRSAVRTRTAAQCPPGFAQLFTRRPQLRRREGRRNPPAAAPHLAFLRPAGWNSGQCSAGTVSNETFGEYCCSTTARTSTS